MTLAEWVLGVLIVGFGLVVLAAWVTGVAYALYSDFRPGGNHEQKERRRREEAQRLVSDQTTDNEAATNRSIDDLVGFVSDSLGLSVAQASALLSRLSDDEIDNGTRVLEEPVPDDERGFPGLGRANANLARALRVDTHLAELPPKLAELLEKYPA